MHNEYHNIIEINFNQVFFVKFWKKCGKM